MKLLSQKFEEKNNKTCLHSSSVLKQLQPHKISITHTANIARNNQGL